MIIFAVPRYIKKRYGAGNWKDYQSCALLLSDLGKPFKILEFEDNDYQLLLDQCTSHVRHLIMYYSWYPEVLSAIRTKAPWIKLHVRTINAEALQHFHREELSIIPNYRKIRSIYGAVRLAWRDGKCKRIADTLLGISEWDDKHYWKFLPGRVKIKSLPHFSPWQYIESDISPLPWQKREKTIVCMPGARDPISTTMIQGFNILSQRISNETSNPKWRFILTRGIMHLNKEVPLYENIELIENVKKPFELLCKSRAVAVLTPLGFGMKTTIVDALSAGCHVLVHPKLANRLSIKLREKCIVFNPDKHIDLEDLTHKLNSPPPSSFTDYNEHLRKAALNILRQTLS